MQVDLDTVLKSTQMAFYVSAIVLAWLTYRSAKRGLLNTVNTEYQKRVMDRLAQVSKALWDDEMRGNHGSLYSDFLEDVRDRVFRIKNLTEVGADAFPELQRTVSGTPTFARHLWDLSMSFETDPFIPAELREPICEWLDRRAMLYTVISAESLSKFFEEFKAGRAVADATTAQRIRNEVMDKITATGFGGPDVNKRLKSFREAIQAYLASFDPVAGHNRRTLKRIRGLLTST